MSYSRKKSTVAIIERIGDDNKYFYHHWTILPRHRELERVKEYK